MTHREDGIGQGLCAVMSRMLRLKDTEQLPALSKMRMPDPGSRTTPPDNVYLTTKSILGKSNLPLTASMMLIWQVYRPGAKDDAGTSN